LETIRDFLPDYKGKTDKLVDRAINNQTLIKSDRTEIRTLETEKILKSYLYQYSKNYKNVLSVEKIAQGGESVVYGVTHTGTDEVVIKCPLMTIG
jgi:hypothetical protein